MSQTTTTTHGEQETLALLVNSAASQESQQDQRGADGDAEKADVNEPQELMGERPKDTEEGISIQGHPYSCSQQGQASQLQEENQISF